MKKTFQTVSPIDNVVYLEKTYSHDNDIQQTLDKATKAQQEWKKTPVDERAEICLKAVDAILEKKTELGEEITRQMGRPIQYSAGEISGFAERARYMIGIARKKLQDVPVNGIDGFKRFIQREPLGIVFAMSPWNYPYLTAVNSIIPAIMAGNAVILKPSVQTPLTAERIQEAFDAAQLSPGIFQYLFLDHEAAHKLIQNDAINYVAFTGSVAAGRAVQHAAENRFIGLGLELGGKDPAYVREDAVLETTVANLVDGAYFNSGQSCCGIERIYVHQSIYTDFVERFCHLTQQYSLGNPLDKNTTLGPMVSVQAAEHVRQQIKNAISAGAKACIDSRLFDADKAGSNYLSPQVLIDVNHTMSVMRDESFGPVVGIMSVKSDEEAIALMNDSAFGLTASVWTNNEVAAMIIGEQVDTGTFFMNRCDYLDPALAWSGFKNSGRGCTLSEIGYEQLTRPKSFHLRFLGLNQ
ncbi:Aldehyde dehydrogenase [hydrothermal vent metagenome]|uniref:Aldehyde dehydrogenase n=1 Tax=hydrothermal vent metagenome TaxID=652676 RepID=A0A3B0ZTK7_9ZZZZ